MPFGQLVIGPPGSGKTTYCNGIYQYLTALGRKVAIVNLDPANDVLPYKPDVDVADLVCLETVMDELHLGPNGGMLYCMEYLAANLDWLKEQLQPLEQSNSYLLIDCPGQVELFTQHAGFKAILDALTSTWQYRLAAVQLVDAHLATDPSKYIAALLLTLSTMLHLELPQVNVLSKVDLVKQYGELAFNLDFYTEVQDLGYLVHSMGRGPFSARYRKLSAGLCEVVEDYGLVAFTPLAIQDKVAVSRVLKLVDQANGAVYAKLDRPGVGAPAEMLVGAAHSAADDELAKDMQDRYIDIDDDNSQQAAGLLRAGRSARSASHPPADGIPQMGESSGGDSSSQGALAGAVVERIPQQPVGLPAG